MKQSIIYTLLACQDSLEYRKVCFRNIDYVYTSKSGLDLNWICLERDPEVGGIAGQKWIRSAISRVNARRIRSRIRSDPVYTRSTFTRLMNRMNSS